MSLHNNVYLNQIERLNLYICNNRCIKMHLFAVIFFILGTYTVQFYDGVIRCVKRIHIKSMPEDAKGQVSLLKCFHRHSPHQFLLINKFKFNRWFWTCYYTVG